MSSAEVTSEAITEHLDTSTLPSLYGDRSFWGMTITQFFGAFNDNLFKQLILLLSITVVAGADSGDKTQDNQWIAGLVFTIPFLAFTGIAGYLSDKYGKRGIVVLCKVAEIAVMILGGIGFVYYTNQDKSLILLYIGLFLMGSQSAFFGPAKYGILPEMLRNEDLPRANGFILMTTFLAIIFGTVVAGFLLTEFRDQLWVGSAVCISIAALGTITSLFVRKVPPANPQLKCEPSSFLVPPDMRTLLAQDRPLLIALLVSSIFWLLAGMVPPAVNILGTTSLALGDDYTSILAGVIGIGIALGCAIGGLVSRGKVNFTLIRIGSIGMLVTLLLMAIPADGNLNALLDGDGQLTHFPGIGDGKQWLGFWGSLGTLLFLGGFTGFFAVPLQVFLQSRPPDDKKGRMIAVMNQANWIGVLLSQLLYWGLKSVIEAQDWPRSIMFLFIAVMILPIVLFYHPKNDELGHELQATAANTGNS
ncbi:MFS transporter [Bythopirellula polymerisocia]|uniref:Lysophospholipid transporter LplT n=1 Tax=Bythopirellula polymerisocia TaxID=2528003 RepID=A0A5C6CEH8_9BACT|nr:MFS transporter [Bythopirellula polymerisocia]TWU21914.1 Lysophospholipid transporter LplT [Bythopirellula polymerisocia]